jgi:hypothetical protein
MEELKSRRAVQEKNRKGIDWFHVVKVFVDILYIAFVAYGIYRVAIIFEEAQNFDSSFDALLMNEVKIGIVGTMFWIVMNFIDGFRRYGTK